ncbi:MAG: magnesium transporter [Euryarchaeota archaeon]|nr:magnesium transporter [Euryarchaeota archaeon]
MAYYTVTGIVKRGIPVLLIAAIISITSGQLLHARQELLIDFSALLILIPPLIKVGGDTGSILGARLSTAFHLGLVESFGGVVVRNSVLACLLIGCVSYVVLSVVVWMAALLLGIEVAYSILLKITLIAGCIDMGVVFAVTVGIASLSHRHGLDPDDVVIPIITSIGDIVGIISVFIAVWVVG